MQEKRHEHRSTGDPSVPLSQDPQLPTFQREHQKLARLCATEGVDHVGYLFRLPSGR